MREQIRPELFLKLQVWINPAKNYIYAFKNVFKNEKEKLWRNITIRRS
jgi:hypothetical protein